MLRTLHLNDNTSLKKTFWFKSDICDHDFDGDDDWEVMMIVMVMMGMMIVMAMMTVMVMIAMMATMIVMNDECVQMVGFGLSR